MQEVVGAVKPVHYEQSSKKIQWQPESRTWRLGHDCVKQRTIKQLAVLYKWFPPVYNGCIGLDYIFI